MSNNVENSPLGQSSEYPSEYAPQILHPIPRSIKRAELGIELELPFVGVDIWTGYELSWLNLKGRPSIAVGVFRIPSESPNIIESKSFKLYLNSFNQSRFDAWSDVQAVMEKDLSAAAGAKVSVELMTMAECAEQGVALQKGICLDGLDVSIDHYEVEPGLLQLCSQKEVSQTLYSGLLKSNCPVTGQPDWGTLVIDYKGKALCHESVLKYIVSFRQHQDFHEQCVERVFMDVQKITQASELSVYARYLRRGGLDINPYRSTKVQAWENKRLPRQ